jgi:hypothetical protein
MGAANPDEVVETPDASSPQPVTRFNLGADIGVQPSEDLETVVRADLRQLCSNSDTTTEQEKRGEEIDNLCNINRL